MLSGNRRPVRLFCQNCHKGGPEDYDSQIPVKEHCLQGLSPYGQQRELYRYEPELSELPEQHLYEAPQLQELQGRALHPPAQMLPVIALSRYFYEYARQVPSVRLLQFFYRATQQEPSLKVYGKRVPVYLF